MVQAKEQTVTMMLAEEQATACSSAMVEAEEQAGDAEAVTKVTAEDIEAALQ